jgi:hypothetical protein
MSLLIIAAVTIVVVSLGVHSLWDRFRSADDDGIREWMLNVPGLEGICRDYLDLIREMKSGQHDRETIHHLDSQRQVTHDQILGYLELDRSANLDVEAFAKRYLGWS